MLPGCVDDETAKVDISRPAPVVLVVFDEFPSLSLLDERGEIDAIRYPSFAELARGSTWYRNATTVDSNTTRAVPAILTGQNPGGAAIFPEHPQNLFTLLGKTYDLEVAEAVTRLCPESLCPRGTAQPLSERVRSLVSDLNVVYLHVVLPDALRKRLPSISGLWGDFRGEEDDDASSRRRDPRGNVGRGFLLTTLLPGSIRGREEGFDAFVTALTRRGKPTLSYLHVLLPHYPWEHLPSGRAYPNAFANPGLTEDVWGPNRFLAEQGWQRHLVQVGYTDRLVGELMDRLRTTGLYERALVVLVADHGVSFRPSTPRKAVTGANAEDLAFVPLFVKAPGQREGRVVDQTVSTLDVLPTIADILGVRVPWAVEGRSVAGRVGGRATVRIDRGSSGVLALDSNVLAKRRDSRLGEQVRLFGSGPWSRAFRLGTRPGLLGKPLADLHLAEAADARVELTRSDWTVDAATVPAFVRGVLTGAGAGDVREVVVAVNGTIAAVVPTYRWKDEWSFSALVSEALFRSGSNDVRAVALSGAAP